MARMGEAMHVWGAVVYGESLYLSLNFTVTLKLFKEKKNTLKTYQTNIAMNYQQALGKWVPSICRFEHFGFKVKP